MRMFVFLPVCRMRQCELPANKMTYTRRTKTATKRRIQMFTTSADGPMLRCPCPYLGSPLSTTTSIAHDLSGSDSQGLT